MKQARIVEEDESLKATEPCFYCGANVRKSGEGDHMPIPKRNGGTNCVPCCETCHVMKDSLPILSWNSEYFAKMFNAIMADMPKMSRETKIFLAKAMALCSDAQKIIDDGGVKP